MLSGDCVYINHRIMRSLFDGRFLSFVEGLRCMSCFRVQLPHQLLKNNINMDYEKVKNAINNLNREKQAQQDRLQLAAEAKLKLDNKKINTICN